MNIVPTTPSNHQYATYPFDAAPTDVNGTAQGPTALTPGAHSQNSSTHTTNGSEGESLEKDPFLSLLEQLAENEHSQVGPSELDFFLTGAPTVDEKEDLS